MVGKVALLVAFVYVLVLVAAAVGSAKGDGISILGYAFLFLPAAAFVVSSRAAVKLHQATDPDQAKVFLTQSALYAGLGLTLLIIVGMTLDRMG